MYDRRVVRGSTFAQHPVPATATGRDAVYREAIKYSLHGIKYKGHVALCVLYSILADPANFVPP
ncbi:hypothetical protein J6590_007103 [Homalodisca vitripennis]|nr:hypothetical protein J6590_007103 [Homalodisca vitripennis]